MRYRGGGSLGALATQPYANTGIVPPQFFTQNATTAVTTPTATAGISGGKLLVFGAVAGAAYLLWRHFGKKASGA